MAVEIVMPHLSDSMEEGTIAQWLVAQGDTVKPGDPLVEVETDKATVTYESEHEGTVLALAAAEGESVAVGAVIAAIGAPGETVVLGGAAPVSEAGTVGAPGVAGVAKAAESPQGVVAGTPAQTNGAGSNGAGLAGVGTLGGRVKASPLARRIAAGLGIDLAAIVGTGPHGRVIRSDVELHAATQEAGSVGPVGPAGSTSGRNGQPAGVNGAAGGGEGATSGAKGRVDVQELSRLQQTIARRMSESRSTVPDFELRRELDMSAVVSLREQIREVTERPPSYNDFIVKAAALALRDFPRVNGAYRDGAFETYERINIGVAVAADDALVVPTIFDADRKSLSEIGAATRDLAAKVRDGSVSPAELSGSTFSISNLGMYGLDSFSAVINAPQAAILAVGSLKPRPVVAEDGVTLVARPTVNVSLACDHRILYGADGARFLERFSELLQAPLSLLL